MALQYSEIDDSLEIDRVQSKPTHKKSSMKNNSDTYDSKKKGNVADMMKLINNTNGYTDSSDHDGLADFNPPPRAIVSLKTVLPDTYPTHVQKPQVDVDVGYEVPTIMNTSASSDVATVPFENTDMTNNHGVWNKNDYKNVPYFTQHNGPALPDRNTEIIINKLNLLIKLLEEQRNEKTGYVNEEIILYAFLGIFIIFIVDSFARSGKYTR